MLNACWGILRHFQQSLYFFHTTWLFDILCILACFIDGNNLPSRVLSQEFNKVKLGPKYKTVRHWCLGKSCWINNHACQINVAVWQWTMDMGALCSIGFLLIKVQMDLVHFTFTVWQLTMDMAALCSYWSKWTWSILLDRIFSFGKRFLGNP